MQVIVGPRGSGKTTELIRMAHETDQYIVVANRRIARHAFDMARGMGLPIRNPVTPTELLRSPLGRTPYGTLHRPGGVLVDDAQAILEQVLGCGRIDAMALCSGHAPMVLSNGGAQ